MKSFINNVMESLNKKLDNYRHKSVDQTSVLQNRIKQVESQLKNLQNRSDTNIKSLLLTQNNTVKHNNHSSIVTKRSSVNPSMSLRKQRPSIPSLGADLLPASPNYTKIHLDKDYQQKCNTYRYGSMEKLPVDQNANNHLNKMSDKKDYKALRIENLISGKKVFDQIRIKGNMSTSNQSDVIEIPQAKEDPNDSTLLLDKKNILRLN